MKEVMATLRDKLADIVTTMGYEFVGCELQRQGRGSLLRIYIDSEKGITADDCGEVSHQVSAFLDVEDPIQGHYILEVSSPGLDRPLFELEQYQKYIGAKIKVRLYQPINNRRNIVGILLRVHDMKVHLMVNDDELVIPFLDIEKAKLIADLGSRT